MAHSGHEYSDRDIEDTLEEMGLVLPDRSYFDDLRKDVNNHTDPGNQFEITTDNLSAFLRYETPSRPAYYWLNSPWGNATMDHADQILKQAEDVLLNSADHMVELEKMVDDFCHQMSGYPFADTLDRTGPFYDTEDEVEMKPEIPLSPTPYKLTDNASSDGKENFPVSRPIVRKTKSRHIEPPNPTDERQKINRMLREKCLRRVYPEPGRMPYRVDRQAMIKWYQNEWAKHPHPGEAKRLNLRRRIREWMLRRHIPVIRLQKRPNAEITRPEWVD